jgi:hypothetical protein
VNHLTRDDLERWWRTGADADRERVVGHLARCSDCIERYGAIIDAESPRGARDDEGLRRQGYAAYADAQRSPVAPRRWHPAWTAAAAAAAALAIGVFASARLGDKPLVEPSDQAVRGSVLRPLAPKGAVALPFEFRWSGAGTTGPYELIVSDRGGTIVWTAEVAGEQLAAPAALIDRLQPRGEYTWQVAAASGGRRITSAPQRFAVVPRGP